MYPRIVKTSKSRLFFFGLFFLVTGAMVWVSWSYLPTVLLAVLAVIIFRPLYLRVLRWVRGRAALATVLTILLIFLIVLIPLTGVVFLTISQLTSIVRDAAESLRSTDLSLEHIVDLGNSVISGIPFVDIDYRLTQTEVFDLINSLVEPTKQLILNQTSNVLSLGWYSLELIAHLFVFVYIMSALFPTFPNFINFIKKLSPLDDRIDDIYIARVIAMIESMVKGLFIIAFIQGLVSGIFYFIAGVPYVMFWIVLATFLSIIPLGSGFVTIPMGLVLLLTGNIWQGLLLILSNILIVSNIDNVLRPKLASKEAQLSEALLLVSILGGLVTMGFLGIIYGPVILILFYTTIEMYLKYYKPETNTRKAKVMLLESASDENQSGGKAKKS